MWDAQQAGLCLQDAKIPGRKIVLGLDGQCPFEGALRLSEVAGLGGHDAQVIERGVQCRVDLNSFG